LAAAVYCEAFAVSGHPVIASAAKQSIFNAERWKKMDCFAALAMTAEGSILQFVNDFVLFGQFDCAIKTLAGEAGGTFQAAPALHAAWLRAKRGCRGRGQPRKPAGAGFKITHRLVPYLSALLLVC